MHCFPFPFVHDHLLVGASSIHQRCIIMITCLVQLSHTKPLYMSSFNTMECWKLPLPELVYCIVIYCIVCVVVFFLCYQCRPSSVDGESSSVGQAEEGRRGCLEATATTPITTVATATAAVAATAATTTTDVGAADAGSHPDHYTTSTTVTANY